MTSSEERCPTCDGTGLVSRNDQLLARRVHPIAMEVRRISPPTNPTDSGALRIVRSAAYAVGAAAVLVLMALLIKVLWQ